MRLVYKATGEEVKVGDIASISGLAYEVVGIKKPLNPHSAGHVEIYQRGSRITNQYFPSVIGAEWVEREDRQ